MKHTFFQRLRRGALWPALLSGFVAPGVGQIANRDYRKGAFLLFAALSAFFWFSRALIERLALILSGPPPEWQLDPAALREAVGRIAEREPMLFITFHVLAILVWGFGVIDAYITAKERLRPQPKRTSQ